ncbi:hypothetical protein F3Y22_tig00110125pilonHSYRG00010 [Hibiscus syriacus]|uniref:PHD-type zinc finger plants domain-containing protein n=1 Tax=Hibiscus syriacus TaxID=106335 RepID=A0A6A3BN74_HIBSY|nr:uncharacterized protein LOC120215596 [Hibiscus syriacus]KAE8716309.1 hypothetical protein F3Y22_tig00110125pilonHSYRG00010 [Hibiscus syriacus]
MDMKIQVSEMNHGNEMKAKSMKISSSSLLHCCMCGDSGITRELFRCKVCHFRSQHRYCSNLYPKSLSNKVCNWCLHQKEDSKEKSQNLLISSASCETKSKDDDDDNKSKKKGDNSKPEKLVKNLIKKLNLEEKLSPRTKRKRIMTNNASPEEKPEENGIITGHVFRNKVRRYKHLDEVST